jgi:hypothetical protein
MHFQIIFIILIALYCLSTSTSNSTAADKVVVVPLGSSLFKGDLYHTISSAAFTLNSDTTTYSRPHFFLSSGYLRLTTTLSAAFASVSLPDGAIVSEFSTYIKDVADGGRCDMRFEKRLLSTNTATEIGLTESPDANSGAYTSVQRQLPSEEVIDNQNYSYSLTWECGGITAYDYLYSVRFKYRLQ